MSDPKDQEREQAAREWVNDENLHEFGPYLMERLVSLLRTREESAYKRGQEEMRERASRYVFVSEESRNVLTLSLLALPIRGMEE